MNYKHQQFINTIKSMTNDENRALMECVVKGYIVNEGLSDFLNKGKQLLGAAKDKISSAAKKLTGPDVTPVHPKVYDNAAINAEKTKKKIDMSNLTPEQKEAKQRLITIDQRTWNHDYMNFQQACEDLTYFLQNYGNREFNQMKNTPDFQKALRRGNLMDTYIRPNPAKSSEARQMAFRAFMDSIMNSTNKSLVESIMQIYSITESMTTIKKLPLTESSNRDYAVHQLKEDMAAIEVFITRHGIYPWQKYLQSQEYRDAYNTSASRNPKEDTRDPMKHFNPELQRTLKDAYTCKLGKTI